MRPQCAGNNVVLSVSVYKKEFGDTWPLNDKQIVSILCNSHHISESITHLTSDILQSLEDEHAITWMQKEFISSDVSSLLAFVSLTVVHMESFFVSLASAGLMVMFGSWSTFLKKVVVS